VPVALELKLLADVLLQVCDAFERVQASKHVLSEFLRKDLEKLSTAVLKIHGAASSIKIFRVKALPVADALPNLRVAGRLWNHLASVAQPVADTICPAVDLLGQPPPYIQPVLPRGILVDLSGSTAEAVMQEGPDVVAQDLRVEVVDHQLATHHGPLQQLWCDFY